MRVALATRGAKRKLRDAASRRFAVAAARAARKIDGKRASAADITRASRALFRALELSISQNSRVYAEFIRRTEAPTLIDRHKNKKIRSKRTHEGVN